MRGVTTERTIQQDSDARGSNDIQQNGRRYTILDSDKSDDGEYAGEDVTRIGLNGRTAGLARSKAEVSHIRFSRANDERRGERCGRQSWVGHERRDGTPQLCVVMGVLGDGEAACEMRTARSAEEGCPRQA